MTDSTQQPAAPAQGERPLTATHGASELDAFTAKVAAHLGIERAEQEAAEAPKPAPSELTPETGVSGSDEDDDAAPVEASEEETSDSDEAPDQAPDDEEGEEKPITLSSLSDLADALEVSVDDLMSMTLPTKVDGEPGQATLKDLLRSHQTDQHLTRRGQKLAEDRKSFDEQRAKTETELQARLQNLDVSLQLANQRLLGKYARIDWNALRETNPQEYQRAYVEYQQLYGELSQAAQALQQEQAKYAEMQRAQYEEYVADQRRLWSQKVPEWSDDKVKTKELSDMKAYMKAMDIDPADLDRLADHRYGMVLRDAMKWHQLQNKAKETKRELKKAGPIVKPGVRKSGAAVSAEKAQSLRNSLRKSGKVDDLATLLKNNWSR